VILVTGSTGRIGQEVAYGLVLADIQFRVLIHNGTGAEWLHWSNVETMMGDYAKPDTLEPALAGITSAFLIGRPSPNSVALETNFIAAAVRAGVQHIVKISMLGAGPAATCRFQSRHYEIESTLLASGRRATILRPNLFMQNLLNQGYSVGPPRKQIATNLDPATKISMIDAADVAEIAIAALLSDDGPSETLELTGPAAMTQPEVYAALSAHLGRTIEYEHRAAADHLAELRDHGVPADLAEGLIEFHAWQNTGAAAPLSGAVEAKTGHAPRSLDDFLKRMARKFN
jgi:uncharacterized protein YbjT (DUF2867 family)